MDFKIWMFNRRQDAIDFVDDNWDRVFNVVFHDDFDGIWWEIRVLRLENKEDVGEKMEDILGKALSNK